MGVPKFGLNRFDNRSVSAFAADVKRAESLGWDIAFQNDSALRRRDPFVMLAAAAASTDRILLAPLIVNPVTRHPAVLASSIATVDELAPGRTILGLGSGDNAVRQLGLQPSRVLEFENATRLIKGLLNGDSVEVGASRPAFLQHHRPVPVWIAAGGPRTLRMAGAYADGVFIRVGTSARSIEAALAEIQAGAGSVGRDPTTIGLGLIVDVVLVDDQEQALLMAKAMAAGHFELTPSSFDRAGIQWNGPPVEQLKHEHSIWPDFHHNRDLVAAGKAVDFLPPDSAGLFSLWGSSQQVIDQATALIRNTPVNLEFVVLAPIPEPIWPDGGEKGYTARMATEVLPVLRRDLASI
jgi:5,10-methylenetetrahydromethanopterin reductase